ncbi:hypothetical protein JZ751_018742 [Albula glossodonta]|uniref:Uncharacterized protein n=1 Tax=Albula glossodonta TaxID=121402 RepID=A0A8T2NW08_9TELE|nr:hypothetical protein JZ751_018742 [Albula glossodonta]
MLGEGFITLLTYREDMKDPAPARRSQGRDSPHRDPIKETTLYSTSLRLIKGKEEAPGMEQGLEQPRLPQPSSSILIPNLEPDQYLGLELYRSWCCTSFCKDYPDLQLRGDPMGDRDSGSPGLDYEIGGGPLLQSEDLGELGTLQSGPTHPGLQVICEPSQDEGYLVMDTSITLDKRKPLSNSMLNGYLESKLLDLYRQHLQDSLARCGFPSVPPTVVLPSVDQLSQQLSLEQGLEASVARDVVTNYLSSLRTGAGVSAVSSHFSSPVLRISNPDQRKKGSSHYQPM